MTKLSRLALLAIIAIVFTACSGNSEYPTETKYLPVQLKGQTRWSIINIENGEVIARDAFETAPSAVIDDMFYVTDSLGQIDYYSINDLKTPINKEKYGSATYFNDGYAIVSRPGTALYIIDHKGNEVAQLPPTIDRAMMFMRSRALVHSDSGKFGFINTDGDTISAIQYGYAAPFLYDDMAVVSRSTATTDSVIDITSINLSGKELFSVSSNDYGLISPYFTSGVLPVSKVRQDTVVFLNRNGEETENPTAAPKAIKDAGYKDGALTRGGYYIALKGDRMGLVDKDNKVMIPFKYTTLVDLSPTRYIAAIDSVFTLVDENGKRVGKAEFTDFVNPNYQGGAVRGFVDTAVLAANLMSLFNDSHACGATKNATLMDLNGLIGNDPTPFVGQRLLPQMMGSLAVVYAFTDDMARLVPGTDEALPTPQFNLDDRVNMVTMSYDLHQCPDATLQEMVTLIESALGTAGFVLDHDNIFVSDNATAVTLGYTNGVFNLYYYMNAAEAKPLLRQRR